MKITFINWNNKPLFYQYEHKKYSLSKSLNRIFIRRLIDRYTFLYNSKQSLFQSDVNKKTSDCNLIKTEIFYFSYSKFPFESVSIKFYTTYKLTLNKLWYIFIDLAISFESIFLFN